MTHEQTVIVLVGSAIAALWLTIGILARRRAKTIRSVLTPAVTAAGWAGVDNVFATAGVKGVWHALAARVVYLHRQKSIPARLALTVRARGVSRLIVQRRTKSLLHNRPLAWFGAPLVDVHHAAQDLWIRADEPAFAERIFGDEKLVSMISKNLTGAFDEVRIDGKGMKITREFPYAPNAFKVDRVLIETTARDELAMAEALLRKIG